jgi:hypothetical protein
MPGKSKKLPIPSSSIKKLAGAGLSAGMPYNVQQEENGAADISLTWAKPVVIPQR